jgi:hypothetical protein
VNIEEGGTTAVPTFPLLSGTDLGDFKQGDARKDEFSLFRLAVLFPDSVIFSNMPLWT